TPGHDFELAAGWLLAEGVIDGPPDLHGVRYCTDPDLDGEQRYNVVTADLKAARRVVERLMMTSSSCGVCGSQSISELAALGHPPLEADGGHRSLAWSTLVRLPDLLAEGQRQFRSTGGLHAAGLVSFEGELLAVREDIGRHNAVDKVIGWAVLGRRFPLPGVALVVSGRTSFEIVQKAVRAGISFVAGISAASSLAARMADESGMTLVGFLRADRCTVYAHPERITIED
ncbi:MAG TPA: formate dehydrogenase accessory sulfurtransferase FdhD, partial [Acidimicrobiales bacterium]|nr:formate dehydrogenase accessory sulfurtransferase FdhD [Acidimicrobiales bacterium]